MTLIRGAFVNGTSLRAKRDIVTTEILRLVGRDLGRLYKEHVTDCPVVTQANQRIHTLLTELFEEDLTTVGDDLVREWTKDGPLL